ncbi:MAG: hypothetical protein M3176_19955 [Chloroflexota bacterium]|nr:hypothetical protein [Chloroflexota bacterium]MDQ6909102.1 hypothetical protein [Chloroflexota bacterium]
MAMYDRFALSPEPDDVSIQDRDLLVRMSAYLDTIEMRVRQGQGWLIFNADRARAARIAQYVLAGLRSHAPLISHFLMTWRDFALNAYITEVALPREEQEEPPAPESRRDQEQRIARRVSREAYWRALNVDVLILPDLAPAHAHEITFLEGILTSRYRLHLPTVVTTPLMPDCLKTAVDAGDTEGGAWEQFWGQMYETSLIAM